MSNLELSKTEYCYLIDIISNCSAMLQLKKSKLKYLKDSPVYKVLDRELEICDNLLERFSTFGFFEDVDYEKK